VNAQLKVYKLMVVLKAEPYSNVERLKKSYSVPRVCTICCINRRYIFTNFPDSKSSYICHLGYSYSII